MNLENIILNEINNLCIKGQILILHVCGTWNSHIHRHRVEVTKGEEEMGRELEFSEDRSFGVMTDRQNGQ